MKRPLFYTGCCCLGGMAAVFCLGIKSALLGLLPLALTVLYLLRRRQSSMGLAVLGLGYVLLGMFLYTWHGARVQARFSPYAHTEMQFVGTVTQGGDGITPGSLEAYGTLTGAHGTLEHVRIRLYVYGDFSPGMGESFTAPVKVLESGGGDAYWQRRAADGCYLSGYLLEEPVLLEHSVYPLRAALAGFRSALYQRIADLMPGNIGGFVSAVTVGIRSGLDRALQEDARRSGLYHIIAISGMHLAIFAQLCALLLQFLPLRRRAKAAVTLALLWVAAALGGLGYSVVRAALMASVVHFGRMVDRVGNSLNALGLALWLILLQNPFAVASLSFQLSAAATMGLCLWQRPLYSAAQRWVLHITKRPLKGLSSGVLSTLTAGVAAQALTLPILYLSMGTLVLNGLPASLAVLPLMTPILMLGYLLCAVLCVFSGAAALIVGVLRPLVQLVLWLMHLAAGLPLILYIRHWWMYPALLGGAALVLWVLYQKPSTAVLQAATAALGVILTVGLLCQRLLLQDTLRVIAPTQSSSLLLTAGQQGALFTEDAALPWLEEELARTGVTRLDVLVLTGDDFLQGADIAHLLERVPVGQILAPDTPAVRQYLSSMGVEYLPQTPLQMTLFGSVEVAYLPAQGLRIQSGGRTVFKLQEFCAIIKDNNALGSVYIDPLGELTLPDECTSMTVLEDSPRKCELLLPLN